MPKEPNREKPQRRVYVLPAELVERLSRYQQELGLTSEVEAVRRLLDSALKSRDTYETLIERFVERLKSVRDLREPCKEVLVDHPLVTSIAFSDEGVEFRMKAGYEITIRKDGGVSVLDDDRNRVPYPKKTVSVLGNFGRSSETDRSGGGRLSQQLDDDIPF